MPQVKNAPSLLKLCLKCIQINIENNICAAAQFLNSVQLDSDAIVGSTSSPFHDLPTNLLEDIIKSLTGWDKTKPIWREKKGLENMVLNHLFTTHQLTNLRFYPFKENYLNYFPNFEKLQVLNIAKNWSIEDSCFKSIGIFCKSLRVLDACGCLNVTDSAVQWLCVGFDNLDVEKGGQCKLLEKLVLYLTKVTKKGIEMALTHLPALKVLDHETTVEALVDMALCNKPFTLKFSLTKLWIFYATLYHWDSLWIAVSVCPMLNNIKIVINNIIGFKDSDFLCLKSIKKICELAIFEVVNGKFEVVTQVTFRHSLAPLLKVSGNSLEKLHLSCVDTVDDIWTIIECCRNLRSLILTKIYETPKSPLEKETSHFRTGFRNKENLILKELNYLHCSSFNIPTEILLFLLSSPSLVSIEIAHEDGLTDNVLKDAAKIHNFHKLEKFKLIDCCAISYKGIDDALMVDSNSLYKINVHDCKEITLGNVFDWKTKANKKYWKLCINFWYVEIVDNNSKMRFYSTDAGDYVYKY